MKLFQRLMAGVLILVAGYGLQYAWQALPIISAFGAKDLCTCVFLNGREADDVLKQELGAGLQSLGSFELDSNDSTVTGTVFGLAKRKAIYRKGLGCTLVSEITEAELRAQKMNLYTMAPLNQDTIPWPMGNMLKTTIDTGVYVTVLKEALDFAFTETDSTRPVNTRRSDPFSDLFGFEDFFGGGNFYTPKNGSGSGVIYSTDGYIIQIITL